MHCHVHYIQCYTFMWMMVPIYHVLPILQLIIFVSEFLHSVNHLFNNYLWNTYSAPVVCLLLLILIHHNLPSPNSTMGTITQGVSLSHSYPKPLMPKAAQEKAK